MHNHNRIERLPYWLKKRLPGSNGFNETYNLVRKFRLNTVCESAACPNIGECYSNKTATFLILGDVCTRGCRFCNISKGLPAEIDKDEPARVSKIISALGLSYVVITSVTRDDLQDGGASQFAKVIRELKKITGLKIEVLIPDFNGNENNIRLVACEKPDVFSHNLETVKRLYGKIRPLSDYSRSLKVLKYVKQIYPSMLTKSGFMIGLGETRYELLELMEDLKNVNCDILTIGQYLRPSSKNAEVEKYFSNDVFEELRMEADKKKFKHIFSGAFVRSSFNAKRVFE